MNIRIIVATIILLPILLCGCNQTPPSEPAKEAEMDLLKTRMNDAFAGLEMYSVDNDYKYPQKLDLLIPKYIDEIPLDPVSRKPVIYKKTDQGFFLSASGNYSALGAETGFPKMNQDGFYVKKESEFPSEPGVDTLPASPTPKSE